jgi:hypothetical protein
MMIFRLTSWRFTLSLIANPKPCRHQKNTRHLERSPNGVRTKSKGVQSRGIYEKQGMVFDEAYPELVEGLRPTGGGGSRTKLRHYLQIQVLPKSLELRK